jgi:protein TilB
MRELADDGVDVEEARKVSDARDLAPDEEDIAEILDMPENERPWCPATRVAEQRESARLRDDQEAKKKANVDKLFAGDGLSRKQKPRRESFPDLPEDVSSVRQCNEGDFEFVLTEDGGDDGDAVVLEIRVGKFMDTSLMDVDVQPRVARALIKGRMLCVTLPEEVRPDASTAQRSKVTGSLVVYMPKARTSPGERPSLCVCERVGLLRLSGVAGRTKKKNPLRRQPRVGGERDGERRSRPPRASSTSHRFDPERFFNSCHRRCFVGCARCSDGHGERRRRRVGRSRGCARSERSGVGGEATRGVRRRQRRRTAAAVRLGSETYYRR